MQKQYSGFIALSTVLIVSIVVLSISTAVSLLSIGDAQSSFSLFKGEDTLQLVEGCTEDALLKARNNPSYNGGYLSRPEGTCTINIVKNGNSWTITAVNTDILYKRTIQAIFIRTSSGINLTSWKEI